MKRFPLLCLACLCSTSLMAQFSRDSIQTDFVLYQRRIDFDKSLKNRTIKASFAEPLNAETEDRYREACWAISQFLFQSPEIENGFRKMFAQYESLENSTKRALLEAVYGAYPALFENEIKLLIKQEKMPKLFAMQAIYLFRLHHTDADKKALFTLLNSNFKNLNRDNLLIELKDYLNEHEKLSNTKIPNLTSLFQFQKNSGLKMIYSFQRWNRDYPGLAIIQNADGSFIRNSNGNLQVFEQLARSASDLPYFITNGSSPQGAYSIQGTAVSHNNFIGPTPNIQLVMPHETDSVYWQLPYDSTKDKLTNYLSLFPEDWRNYQPMKESFNAGKIGRTEIIAHGTTIDPEYFKDKPYYPLTPTMGCLCAKEDWNIFNGKFLGSDQFNMVQAFVSSPGNNGYLFVINLDNQLKPVSKEELENLVSQFEKK